MNTKKIILLIIISISVLSSQNIPSEFFDYQKQTFLYDLGESWETNSILNGIRFYNLEKKNIEERLARDSLYIKPRFGLIRKNNDLCVYGFGHFIYQKYLYGYLYPRIVNNHKAFNRFSGIPRNISRSGFNSGETDMSGIGFENSWLNFQLGRGRENWGSGDNINVILNNHSHSYDYFALSSNYQNIRVRYFHGFLESNLNKVNRYINGRGLEWTNQKSINVALTEIIIYSGENRPLDIAYLNPMASHLEIELNNRLNITGSDGANAIWQLSSDIMLNNGIRISGNYFYDEFVLDKEGDLQGKEHGKGYSLRLSKTKRKSNGIFTIYCSLISIGTPVFRHGNGNNNFVQRGRPLGWKYGSDGEETKFGFNLLYKNKLISKISVGIRTIGEESILNRPYEKYKDYLAGSFPSGLVESVSFSQLKIEYWLKRYSKLTFDTEYSRIENQGSLSLNIGIDLFIKSNYTL